MMLPVAAKQWLVQHYQCQLIYPQWQPVQAVHVSQPVLASGQRLYAELFPQATRGLQKHDLQTLQCEWLGLRIESAKVQRIISVNEADHLVTAQTFIRRQLAQVIGLTALFPHVPVTILTIIPPLAPAEVIGLERAGAKLQVQLKTHYPLCEMQMAIMQPQVAQVTRRATKATSVTIDADLKQLIRQRKLSSEAVLQLQNRQFTKMMFGIDYPVLMTRSNYLRSQYPRTLFAQDVVVITGKEYFVCQAWSESAYARWQAWAFRA